MKRRRLVGRVDADDLLIAAERVDRDVERDRVNVEAALGVHGLRRGPQLEQVEDGLNIGIEAVVTLAGEREIAALELGNGLRRVAVEIALVADAVPGRLLTVVIAVVSRRGVSLVVRGDDSASETSRTAAALVDPVHGVALDEILRGIADITDDAEIRLQNRVAVAIGRVELELIALRGAAFRHVLSGGDADLVEDVVVEVVLVRADARFLVRVDRQGRRQVFLSVTL